MKNLAIITVTMMVASITFAQKAQEKDVPTAVKAAFQKQYPLVKAVKWDKEEDKFEASFNLNKTDNSVLFDKKGNILESEVEILVNQLPKVVLDYVKANYKAAAVKEFTKITDEKGAVTFEVEIKKMDLLFDRNGKFIKEIKN